MLRTGAETLNNVNTCSWAFFTLSYWHARVAQSAAGKGLKIPQVWVRIPSRVSSRFMTNAVPTTCYACGAFAVRVVDTRKENRYSRRRKKCTACGKRFTLYELSEEYFNELRDAKTRLDVIYKALSSGEETYEQKSNVSCDLCIHMTSRGCQLDFPEAGGSFAAECSSYQEFV